MGSVAWFADLAGKAGWQIGLANWACKTGWKIGLAKLAGKSGLQNWLENWSGKAGWQIGLENLAGKSGWKIGLENLAGKLGWQNWGTAIDDRHSRTLVAHPSQKPDRVILSQISQMLGSLAPLSSEERGWG